MTASSLGAITESRRADTDDSQRVGRLRRKLIPYSQWRNMENDGHASDMTALGAGVGAACPICDADGVKLLLKAPDRFHMRREIYQLLRCTHCAVVWLHDAPPRHEMWRHYGASYDRAITRKAEAPFKYWREPLQILSRYKSGGNILDLGCSSGSFLGCLPESWKLNGIEFSEGPARIARETTGASVFVGDILQAPYPPASFDAITCFHVFEHLYEPQRVMERIRELLKPDGMFYAQMPNIDSAAARIFRSYWYALELPRHLFHFSPRSLSYLARSAGLDIVALWTDREPFVEASTRYLLDTVFHALHLPRAPLATVSEPGIPWRVTRKVLRSSILPLVKGLMSLAGDGELLNVVLRRHP